MATLIKLKIHINGNLYFIKQNVCTNPKSSRLDLKPTSKSRSFTLRCFEIIKILFTPKITETYTEKQLTQTCAFLYA